MLNREEIKITDVESSVKFAFLKNKLNSLCGYLLLKITGHNYS